MTEMKNEPVSVTLTYKEYIVRIHRGTINALNDPKYIRMLFNPKNCLFAVQSVEVKDGEAFQVPADDPDKEWRFRIHSKNMVDIIYGIMQWNKEFAYRINGEIKSDYHLAEFDLMNAFPIESPKEEPSDD